MSEGYDDDASEWIAGLILAAAIAVFVGFLFLFGEALSWLA